MNDAIDSEILKCNENNNKLDGKSLKGNDHILKDAGSSLFIVLSYADSSLLA